MCICQHLYCFLIKSSDSFCKNKWYSKANFLSNTISSSSKIGFLFAKLFCVKDCLLFTAKVSDSIDTSFISPHFLLFTNTNWKGKLCWKAFRTTDSHARIWLSTFSLWNNGVYPAGYKASTWNKTRMINNGNNWTIFGVFCYIIAVIMSTTESDYLTVAIWRGSLFHLVIKCYMRVWCHILI